jgi:hypothetical protein
LGGFGVETGELIGAVFVTDKEGPFGSVIDGSDRFAAVAVAAGGSGSNKVQECSGGCFRVPVGDKVEVDAAEE